MRRRRGEEMKMQSKKEKEEQSEEMRKTARQKRERERERAEQEQEEHEVRITKLCNELHEYALRHGYSEVDLYDAAYTFTVESLSLLSKKDAKKILRKLEEGADGLREVLSQKTPEKTSMAF